MLGPPAKQNGGRELIDPKIEPRPNLNYTIFLLPEKNEMGWACGAYG